MQKKKPTMSPIGRPTGTDGSDFSYRMVVDSRYTKVAKGKSRLVTLIFLQVAVQLIGVLYAFLLTTKEESRDKLVISSIVVGAISVLIGELGRRNSRVNFLKLYIIVSSAATFLSIGAVVRNILFLEFLQDLSSWKSKKFELLGVGYIALGLLMQSITSSTVTNLIHNMSPPKRAS